MHVSRIKTVRQQSAYLGVRKVTVAVGSWGVIFAFSIVYVGHLSEEGGLQRVLSPGKQGFWAGVVGRRARMWWARPGLAPGPGGLPLY